MIFTDKNFINFITKENNKNEILKLINFVDKDITDFIPITRKVIGKSFKINIDSNNGLNSSVIEEASDSSEIDEIIFKKDGVDFTFMETSNGLLKLMQIIPNLFNVIKNDGILIVDELDTGLNPKIYENLLSLFKDKKGQLIFTTHNLLFLENLKTSQICIVEKENHHSIVNLLSKFYKDTNYANYIRDYLQDKLTLNYLEKKDLPKTEFNDSILDDI
jgi:ABC-type multidrug transport system ATPase subunit